jgi:lipoic acid synthetase
MDRTTTTKKPYWIKVRLPAGGTWKHVDEVLSRHGLATVCNEARCPNKGECWGSGTATFMILGDTCTRGCRFCAVKSARLGSPLRADEPEALAAAARELRLRYVVVTAVDRDDLPDRGSAHFAACVRAIKSGAEGTKVEVLIPDYRGEELQAVAAAGPEVLAHNIETVRRLQSVRDARAGFDKSIATLLQAKAAGIGTTKSSILLGLGETRDELKSCFAELREAGVDILVMGQYLRPTDQEIPVAEYVHPDLFALYAEDARSLGFAAVVASPFARTSYRALEAWEAGAR